MSVSIEQLKEKLQSNSDIEYVAVDSDGHHYQLTVVSEQFIGLSRLARQKWVYTILKDWIVSGELHAVEMQTWTKVEWEKQHG